jgi:hypothetical protein
MTPVHVYDKDAERLLTQFKTLTDVLAGLHSDLHWLAMNAPGTAMRQLPVTEQDVETLAALKSAIDDMRVLLWNYIETAAEVNPARMQDALETHRLLQMGRFLRLLRERLGRSRGQQPLSFIEKISAEMKERLVNHKSSPSRSSSG